MPKPDPASAMPDDAPAWARREPVPVRRTMSHGVLTVDPDEPLVDAAETMNANEVSGLVVVEEGRIEGIVTGRDVMRAIAREGGDVSRTTVRDAMTTPVVTIPPHVSVEDTLRAMAHKGLHRMPVASDGDLVGMVTERDVLDRFPELAAVARSLSRELSTAHTDHTRTAGRCHGCGHGHHDLRDVDGHWYCYDCAGGVRIEAASAEASG